MLGKSFETVKWLEAKGKKVFFITNSSGKTREDFIKSFRKMGLDTVRGE